MRITRDQAERFPVDPPRLVEPSEQALWAALQQAEAGVAAPQPSPERFLSALLPMIPLINRFFEDVLVMADDPALRRTRLGLLQRIAALAAGSAEMSRLEGF